jgi:alkylhydroperoxidase family enzyme
MQARVQMLSRGDAMERAAEIGVSGQLAPLNVFRVLLRRPRAAKAMADLLLELLSGRALESRLRELAIMRVGWATGSEYEWTQHWRIAQDVFGLDPEDLLAVRDWEHADRLGPVERAVLAATDEMLASGGLSPATLEACREALGDDEALLELTLVVGVWGAVSVLCRSLGIPIEDGTDSWPPDHLAPP